MFVGGSMTIAATLVAVSNGAAYLAALLATSNARVR